LLGARPEIKSRLTGRRQARQTSVRAVRPRLRASADLAAAALALGRCILFQVLDPAQQLELARHAHRRRYRAGTPIFQFGDPGDSMMAVLSGTVRIARPAVGGRELVLTDAGAGDLFGEIAMLDGAERSAGAAALTNCEVLVLERSDSLRFLRSNPEACLKLLAFLCARVRRSDERMIDLGFSEIPVRLAKVLLDRAGPRDRLPWSQSELADMIGATRENVNRHLMEWQRRGIVQRANGWIVILQRQVLGEIAART
jgi:CRP/FNR family cyclic AMP-dependent transcriptional regulator